MNDEKIKIFLVDDDAVYLKLLEIEFLQHGDFEIETYATGELCIENLQHAPDVIVLDYYLDGINKTAINGIETLDKIKAVNSEIAVIMLSCQDSIDIAISCMHHKAYDYVMKSETAFLRLQKIITTIFSLHKLEKQLKWYMERM
ncbi:MAG: histidine kinase [Bacteroidetes bacterium GWF2_42_66]|nr:MAG: histidine kinase [Bacteroidetes bacterium GWA2_42_15]OFX97505.1 MAG: histidine kinase [Bacteroidetes bacterium GWE2_42_39]OFY43800.1 MAG: histidine kinase [Bacteroidetes bacterium GWF2_42_66]HBL76219.1 response regulator [Prolixibacteraceae bacterium]HCU60457.1 response regulator [Prolixibacteraceae bacterium]